MLVGLTGLRRSELFALRWSDINFFKMEVAITRSCVWNRLGEESSRKRLTEPATTDGSVITAVTVTVVGVPSGTVLGLTVGDAIVGAGGPTVILVIPNFVGSWTDFAFSVTTPELGTTLGAVKMPAGEIVP